MKIKYLNTNKEEHVENYIGARLVNAGIAIEIKSPQQLCTVADTRWSVHEGALIEDRSYMPPEIAARCSGCGRNWHMVGPNVHKTQQIIHCGIKESVPEHIGKEYAKVRGAWEKRQPKPKQLKAAPPDPYGASAIDRARDSWIEIQRIKAGDITIDESLPIPRARIPSYEASIRERSFPKEEHK